MTGAELAATSRAAQNLPEHVENVDVLARVAALLRTTKSMNATNGRPRQAPVVNDNPEDEVPNVRQSA
jgi:hypothetical protein